MAVALAGIGSAALAAAPAGAADPAWGFEQVSPPEKGGGTVAIDTFRPSPDGNAFLYTATAPFTGVPTESAPQYTRYLGTRGANGWANRGLDPLYDSSASISSLTIMTVLASSSDLSHVVVASPRALTPGATEGGSNLYMRDTSSGALTLMATSSDPQWNGDLTNNYGELNVKFVAADGQSALFGSSVPLVTGAPSGSGSVVLYRWTAAGGVQAASVLPVNEGGAVVPFAYAGRDGEDGARDSLPSDDALAHVYFTDRSSRVAYVRAGDATKAVSVSEITGTAVAAQVDAVGAGGRYLLFHTLNADRLTAQTPDMGGSQYLYRYDVTDGSLTYVGAGALANAGVRVVQMTQDGLTVAFQSTLALAGDGVADQRNMYVWRNGSLRYVETAEAGSSPLSGTTYLRVLSSNGRYLAFTDNSVSTAQRFGVDNVSAGCAVGGNPGPCNEVYLFDAVANGGKGALSCVSCRTDGKPPVGDAGDPNNVGSGMIRMDGHQAQTVADDGTVFFTSSDDLVPADGNGATDVYASHEGQLRLVSRGLPGTSSRFLDATPDGKTVFIATNDPIVGTDVDRDIDVYMTRAGAGFPYTAPEVLPPCTGSDCRAPFVPTTSLAPPGSAAFVGPGNPVSVVAEPSDKLRVSKAKKIRGSSTRVKVKVPGKGVIRVTGSGVRRSSKKAKKAGTSRVLVRLSKRSRRTLRRRHRVSVRVTVRFAPSKGKASSTRVKLTFKATSSSKKKGR